MSTCEHCGTAIEGRKASAKFCSQACARSRHNVKMLRGAAIHDLLLTWRSSYKNRKLITQIGRAVKVWVEEEKALKNGRDVALNVSPVVPKEKVESTVPSDECRRC